ncbi:MAG: hypothetical protein ABIO35_04070 [Nitrobacter sp.]
MGETAAGPVVAYFAQVWRDILAERTFSVRNPVVTGPFILKALSRVFCSAGGLFSAAISAK